MQAFSISINSIKRVSLLPIDLSLDLLFSLEMTKSLVIFVKTGQYDTKGKEKKYFMSTTITSTKCLSISGHKKLIISDQPMHNHTKQAEDSHLEVLNVSV